MFFRRWFARASTISSSFRGGLVDPFLPALARRPDLTPIVAAREGGAAYMADGYAHARAVGLSTSRTFAVGAFRSPG